MVRIVFASLTIAVMALASVGSLARSTTPTVEDCRSPAVATSTDFATPRPASSGEPDSAPLADADTSARVIAGIENFVTCRNSGDLAAYAALLTPSRMLAEAGTTNPDDIVAGLQAFNLPITILSLGDVRVHADGRLSAEFVHLFGEHLYYRSRIYVIEQDGFVKFDEELYLPEEPRGDQASVEVEVVDFAFQLDRSTVDNAQFVVLRGHNGSEQPHDITVVRLPEGTTVEQALSGQVDESTIEFIGQTTIAPGESDDLVLVNLQPGTYTLLCLQADPDGVPHAAKGMVAELTLKGEAKPTTARRSI